MQLTETVWVFDKLIDAKENQKYQSKMLSKLYGWITDFRNYLYNNQYLKTTTFDITTISVGNLSVGGTGKTPHIEYLIRLFKSNYKIATLSRGYGRKTKGFLLADSKANASIIGDEPFQFYQKFGNEITVSVGEERILAVPHLLYDFPETNLLLLDDAYQHRAIGRHINILLTDYHRLFYQDKPLPFGRLRENIHHANRADAVIVSKCPPDISIENQEKIKEKIAFHSKKDVPVFFSGIEYAKEINFDKNQSQAINQEVLLVTGIAQTDELLKYVKKKYGISDHLSFPDHHQYTPKDKIEILQKAKNRPILCTEKDFVKLYALFSAQEIADNKVFYLPIQVYFLDNQNLDFDFWISDATKKHRKFVA